MEKFENDEVQKISEKEEVNQNPQKLSFLTLTMRPPTRIGGQLMV